MSGNCPRSSESHRVSKKRAKRSGARRPVRRSVRTGCRCLRRRLRHTTSTQIMAASAPKPAVLPMHATYAVSEATLAAETMRAEGPGQGPLDQQFERVTPFVAPLLAQALTRPPRATYDLHASATAERMRVSLETCPRSHDDMYLCEAVKPQRTCSQGDACQSLALGGFALREFLRPSEHEQFLRTGALPTIPGMCLMCERHAVIASLVAVRSRRKAFEEDTLLQSFCNVIGPGEYRAEDCIISQRRVWEGLPSPLVLHTHSSYAVQEQFGVRGYKQLMPLGGAEMPFLASGPAAT